MIDDGPGYPGCMTRVMIALDGTELDRVIAPVAHDLFGEDAEYWAVNVGDDASLGGVTAVPGAIPVGYGAAYPYAAPDLYAVNVDSDRAQEMIDEAERVARESADAAGLDHVEAIGAIGAPDEAILRAARDHDADVVVVGTHDRSWWSKLVQPSVADGVLADSRVPVLLVNDPN